MEKQEIAAALLAGATGGARPTPELASGLDEAGAYAVQEELMKLWEDRGVRSVGYKVALTTAALQEKFGVTEPSYGRLLDSCCYADGKELALPEGAPVKVEC